MRRAVVLANKWWEADPLVAVLSSAKTTPSVLRFVPSSGVRGCRGSFVGGRARVDVWCLQELMATDVSGSSTEEKGRVLPALLAADDIGLVVAFGTAATPTQDTHNGCVVIGTNVFIHDPKWKDTQSHWVPEKPDVVITSSLDDAAFQKLVGAPDYAKNIEPLLLAPPGNPAKDLRVMVNRTYVALATINITDPHQYVWADPAVVAAYAASKAAEPVGSLETTHAVMRAYTRDTVPFMFVSGITDRVGYFDEDMKGHAYQQNFVAAHNAGVAVAQTILQILTFLYAE